MKTEIVCIIDRSGSMASVRDDVIGGFNTFLKDQQAMEGEANLTLIMFDDKYDVITERQDLNTVIPLTPAMYVPHGTTALYDAIGRSAVEMHGKTGGEVMKAIGMSVSKPKVIVVIMTDGHENSSTHYSMENIKTIITENEKQNGWEFIYLGADQDSFLEAGKIGIKAGTTANYEKTPHGILRGYETMSNFVGAARMEGGDNA